MGVDAVYEEGYKRGEFSHWHKTDAGVIDLHYWSVPVAKAAVRYALLKEIKQQYLEDPSAYDSYELVLCIGHGHHRAGPTRVKGSKLREPITDELVRLHPFLMAQTQPDNTGRLYVNNLLFKRWLRLCETNEEVSTHQTLHSLYED